jgi:hypothetical protein
LGKSSNPPEAPDPTVLANTQGTINADTLRQTARLNRPQQYTPFGSSEWELQQGFDQAAFDRARHDWLAAGADPEKAPQQNAFVIDNWTNRQAFDPRVEDSLFKEIESQGSRADLANFMSKGVRHLVTNEGGGYRHFDPEGNIPAMIDRVDPEATQRQVSLNGLGQLPGQMDFGGERDSVENALYRRHTAKLTPEMEERRLRLESDLANQGFARGSEGWNREMDRFSREQESALGAARDQSIIGGGAEQSRLFGDALAARQQGVGERFQQGDFANRASLQDFNSRIAEGNFRNSARGQRFGEELSKRNQAFSEYGQLIHGTGATQPQFGGAAGQVGGVNSPDFMGAAMGEYGANMQAHNATQARRSQETQQAITSAAKLAASYFSDRNIKDVHGDVDEAETLAKVQTLPVERWNYKGDTVEHVGPMAQEWAKLFGGDGKTISAIDVMGVLLASVKALADRIDRMEAAR